MQVCMYVHVCVIADSAECLAEMASPICRLSESNLQSVGSRIEELYRANSRNGDHCSTYNCGKIFLYLIDGFLVVGYSTNGFNCSVK